MGFKVGGKVSWKWLGRTVLGTVEDRFTKSVTRKIKGKKITRHGTSENPAYLVKSEAGNLALKLESELFKKSDNSKKSKASSAPKMFKD